MSKAFYERRIAEETKKLNDLIAASMEADGEAYEQLVKEVTRVQHEVNTLTDGMERMF